MFFISLIHSILSFGLVFISIEVVKYEKYNFQFTNIDSLFIKDGKYQQINEKNKILFYFEILLSFLLTIFSFITYSKLILIISISIVIYNVYILLTKQYNLDFILGDTKYNERSYYQESFKYKIKFMIYLTLCTVSFFILFMRIIYLILDKVLTEKKFLIPIFKFFGVYEDKK